MVYTQKILRVVIGLFFIVSAVLKLFSLDNFELYIYSFNFVNFTWSALVARVIIACEILVGILLIIKVKYKAAWWLTMLMLVGFSLLLVYVLIFRDDSNCHCMGDFVDIKPSVSLVKNLVAIAIMWFIRNEEESCFRGRTVALVLAFVVAFVPPFVLFPMDDVYNLFAKTDGLKYNETAFNALMADSTMQEVDLEQDKYIVGVVSARCNFCRISCLKMSEIVDNNQLDTSRILFFVWGPDSAAVELFKTETKTESFRYVPISALAAVEITRGEFPIYLFMNEGEVVGTADLRHLTEKAVCDHLLQKPNVIK